MQGIFEYGIARTREWSKIFQFEKRSSNSKPWVRITSTPQKAEKKVRTHAHGSEELLVVATFQTSREVLNLSPAGNLGHVALMTRRRFR